MPSSDGRPPGDQEVRVELLPHADATDESIAAAAASTEGQRATTQSTPSAWRNVPAVVPIASWIALSSGTIVLNKYILSDLKFSYPIALTTMHLSFQVAASRTLARTTHLLDSAKEMEAKGVMNNEVYTRKIVPIGVLFSLSLVLSNYVYLRLTVSFIQMIKAITPVIILLLSFAWGLKTISQKVLGIVSLISIGIFIASAAEVQWDTIGFTVQIVAIFIESTRLLLVQILLQDASMNPLTSLYYFAPVCLVCNALVLLPVEGFAPFQSLHLVGVPTLLFNACCTFLLNLSGVWLIGVASGLVLTLSGVLKDILLIVASWLAFGSVITPVQILGYAIALTGLVLFKTQS